MKRFYLHSLRLQSIIYSVILSWLGFGCSSKKDISITDNAPKKDKDIEIRLMYGCPMLNYTIKGKVSDANTQPLDKAQVIITRNFSNILINSDTIYSNSEGEFIWKSSTNKFSSNENIDIQISDPQNGTKKSENINFSPKTVTKDTIIEKEFILKNQ